jgi:hypothetical protein
MKSGINFTLIVLLLSFLTVSINAQDETILNKKKETVRQHNKYMFDHIEAMLKVTNNPDYPFNKKSFRKHARGIKLHAKKARAYVNKLNEKETDLKESETTFNGIIEHYDKILQEEFEIEKELDMPASDRQKLASHLSIIQDELDEIKKEI